VSQFHTLAWLARADFLERTRRASFLLVMAAALGMMWLVHTGNLTVRVGDWRGMFNAAWLGMMLVSLVAVFISLFGFYLVKDTLTRDRQTGVGQIVAATPTSTALYLLGKWASNTLVLMSIMLVCALAALVLMLVRQEAEVGSLWHLVLPVLFIAGPALAIIAALAVVFESVPWLRGGFGNVAFFFVWIAGLAGGMDVVTGWLAGLDPFGLALFMPDIKSQVRLLDPTYKDSLLIGGGPREAAKLFLYDGLAWTPGLIALRGVVLLLAASIAVTPVLWFDRFRTPGVATGTRLDLIRRVPRLDALFDALGMVGAELRMLLAGQPWWWLAGLVICALVQLGQPEALVFGWLWPVLAWSVMGCRAERDDMLPLILSTPRPVLRPVFAAWIAGGLLAALAGFGTLVNLVMTGDSAGLLAFLIACLAIPALALACGTVAGSARLFEILWLCVWYIGLLNREPTFDVMRMREPDQVLRWTAITLVALGVALVMRQRRLRVGT
jgi:hypothetical protein